jgi:hypothetical protein
MHNHMIHFIKNLLYHTNSSKEQTKDKNKEEEQDSKTKPPCSLELEMNFDGTINIICSWPEFNEENKKSIDYLANYFALMIDAVNTGLLEQEIINTLKNYSSNNYSDILFAQNVYYKILELNFLRKEQEKFSNPLIKPSQVFRRPG